MRNVSQSVLSWVLYLDPATLKWPAAVLVALCFGLVLFGLVQYQAFNRLWGIQLVLGLAGGAVVAGLGAAIHWFLGVLYGLGYVLTWLVWVLTRRWRGWRQRLARGLTAALCLGPWLYVGATERTVLLQWCPPQAVEELLAGPGGFRLAFWLSGMAWVAVLVAGWGCWRAVPTERRAWRRVVLAAWVLASALGLNWYAAGRVDLRAACKSGHRWRLAYVLVSRPGSVWYRGFYGQTPLHWAADSGSAATVRLLLAAGAAVNAKAEDGGTPLHLAAGSGRAEAIRLLLAAGADAEVNAKDEYGCTSLHWAAGNGTAEAIWLLLAADAEVNAKAKEDWTPLHWAAGHGMAEAVRLLLAADAEVNAKDKYGSTPLHWAASFGQAEAIRLLLAAGAAVNARDVKGKTAMDVAGRDEMDVAKRDASLEALRQAGGKIGKALQTETAPAPRPPE